MLSILEEMNSFCESGNENDIIFPANLIAERVFAMYKFYEAKYPAAKIYTNCQMTMAKINHLDEEIERIPDQKIQDAVKERRKNMQILQEYEDNQMKIRIKNYEDDLQKGEVQHTKVEIIAAYIEKNNEIIPETATAKSLNESHQKLKKISDVPDDDSKILRKCGLRQFQRGLLLFIQRFIQEKHPNLHKEKDFEVKSSIDPQAKTILALHKYIALKQTSANENSCSN